MNWNDYPNFSKTEFDCKHTGKNRMRPEFMERLQQIRKAYGQPMRITSGYRDPLHPIEARKAKPGEHSYGVACDVAVDGLDAMDLIVIAYGHGIRRIGVKQNGSGRFIHLGMGDKDLHFKPTIWSY